MGGQHDLPELVAAGTERACATQQVVAPHAVEMRGILVFVAGPSLFKIGMPGHQGGVVVSTEIVHVLRNKKSLGGLENLGQTGDFTVGKNVFVHPRVGRAPAKIAADGVQQHQAIFRQTAPRHLKEFAVIPAADVLEHAHTGNAIVCAVKAAVIHQAKHNRQPFAMFRTISGLLAGDGYTCA